MLNEVRLIGNVGKDPEVRYVSDGVQVVRFSLATTDRYKNRAGKQIEETEWHNIVAWRRLAEIVEKYVEKGRQICVLGKLKTNKYTDKEGIVRYKTEIVASRILLLGSRKNKSADEDLGEPIEDTPED